MNSSQNNIHEALKILQDIYKNYSDFPKGFKKSIRKKIIKDLEAYIKREVKQIKRINRNEQKMHKAKAHRKRSI